MHGFPLFPLLAFTKCFSKHIARVLQASPLFNGESPSALSPKKPHISKFPCFEDDYISLYGHNSTTSLDH